MSASGGGTTGSAGAAGAGASGGAAHATAAAGSGSSTGDAGGVGYGAGDGFRAGRGSIVSGGSTGGTFSGPLASLRPSFPVASCYAPQASSSPPSSGTMPIPPAGPSALNIGFSGGLGIKGAGVSASGGGGSGGMGGSSGGQGGNVSTAAQVSAQALVADLASSRMWSVSHSSLGLW